MRTFCLDTSVVSDFLKGRPYVEAYLETIPVDATVVVPTLVRFEAYV